MNNELHSNSRSGYRAKRKKTNVILNSLIVVVLLLIIFVAYTIFSSPGSNNAASKQANKVTAQKTSKKKDNTVNQTVASDNKQSSDTSSQTNQQNQDGQTNQDNSAATSPDQSQAVVTNGSSSDPNVAKTVENPAWKPVGTTQTGQHTTQYDESSVDWQEMLNAITVATGLEQNNMIVQFLGRDRSTTNGSVGTVYSKDKQQKYRVYIKWVDGQGWEPTKVEELK